MDSFDMEPDFENKRYMPNRRVLSDMCNDVGISTSARSKPSSISDPNKRLNFLDITLPLEKPQSHTNPRSHVSSSSEANDKKQKTLPDFIKNNGCILLIIAVVIIVFTIAAISGGLAGVGCVFIFLALFSFMTALGKGDIECGIRLVALILAFVFGIIGYALTPNI